LEAVIGRPDWEASPASPGWATTISGTVFFPVGTLTYRYDSAGVWAYKITNIPALPVYLTALEGGTARTFAQAYIDYLQSPIPSTFVSITSPQKLKQALRNEGYGTMTVALELFRRHEPSIAKGTRYATTGLAAGALAFLTYMVLEGA
jgi:hypothetical protein